MGENFDLKYRRQYIITTKKKDSLQKLEEK